MAGQFGGYLTATGGGGAGGGGGSPSSGGLVVDGTFNAGEPISGGLAVALTQSGTVQTAMASVSGRMPSIGVVASNHLSGSPVSIIIQGKFNSTFWNFSGWAARPLYVGASGDVVASGAPTASGNVQQMLGVSFNASGLNIIVGDPLEGVVAGSGDVGSGAIQGAISSGWTTASGTFGQFDFGSGAVMAGQLGSGSVQSGNVSSGSLGTNHYSSGSTIRNSVFTAPSYSGTSWSINCLENISGIRAVGINQSGLAYVAMASVSGRMPAVGVCFDNVLSGLPVNIYVNGIVTPTSGLFTAINYFGQPVWVGRSGQLCPLSGSFGSGGFASGDIGQKIGVALAIGSGGIFLNHSLIVCSGGPLGFGTGGVI